MQEADKYVVFKISDIKLALHIDVVERVYQAFKITSFPGLSASIPGIVDIHGEIIPVYDIRYKFKLQQCEMELNDYFIIVTTSKRSAAILVNELVDVAEYTADEIVDNNSIAPVTGYIEGVIRLSDGMILIQNLDNFLLPEEEALLGEGLRNVANGE